MNYTEYLKKIIPLKVSMLMSKLAIVAAVMALMAANAASATILVANDVTRIAAAQITPLRLDAGYHYAENVPNTYKCRMAQVLPCAAVAMENITAKKSGVVSQSCLQNQELSLRMKMAKDNDYLSDLDKIVIEGDKLKVWNDPISRRIRKFYKWGIVDSYTASFIKIRVNKAKRELAFSGLPFLQPSLFSGDFFFGKSLDGKTLVIPTQWLNGHLLQVCGTGGGKTNASKIRAINIASKLSGCWLIDLRKTEYRSLLPIFEKLGIDLKVIRGRQFKINPLSVPLGVAPIDYASVISECLVRVLNLPPRSATLLKTTIIRLYAEKGVLNGGIEAPTLFDLYNAVKNNRDANSQARQAITDNLYALLISLGPEVLGYSKGWDVHQLAKQHLVIELSGLCEAGKDLILSYLLTAEFISRIARGVSNPKIDFWIAFDEGGRLFSSKKESAGYGGNPLIDLLGLVRGTGIGVEISVLTTVDLSPSIPNLTASKIIGRCGSISEYTTAGHFVGLNTEQINWAAHNLVPGTFIGQVGEGNFRYPFVFRMPLVKDLNLEPVSNTDTDKNARKIVTSKVIKSQRLWS